ncbi:MAG: hypothetical protein RI967_1782, partial [Planctomycetota bacterium]
HARAGGERVVRPRGRPRRWTARERRSRDARRVGGRRIHDPGRRRRPSRRDRSRCRGSAATRRDARGSVARGVGVVRILPRDRRAATRRGRAARPLRRCRVWSRVPRAADRPRPRRRRARVATARARVPRRAIGRRVRPVGGAPRRGRRRRRAGLRPTRARLARRYRGRGRRARLRRAQWSLRRRTHARVGASHGALRKRDVRLTSARRSRRSARERAVAAARADTRHRTPLPRGGEPRTECGRRDLAPPSAGSVTRSRARPRRGRHRAVRPRRARRTSGRASASSPRWSSRR